MKRITMLALAGVLTFTSCSGDDTETAATPDAAEEELAVIRGSISLVGAADGDATDCAGKDGFDDIAPGATVTARDGEGDIAGTAALESGSTEQDITERLVAAGDGTESEVEELLGFGEGWFCPLFFDVEVADAEFYEIEVGRRDITISKADLEEADWRVSRTLDGL